MDLTKGDGWEEQEIGKCSACGGWVVVYHSASPAIGPLRLPWCIACGAGLSRDSVLPMTEEVEEGPWLHLRDQLGIEDPSLRRAYEVGLRQGYQDGARAGFVPSSIEALASEV